MCVFVEVFLCFYICEDHFKCSRVKVFFWEAEIFSFLQRVVLCLEQNLLHIGCCVHTFAAVSICNIELTS